MSLTNKDKSALNSCLKESNCLVILTTGRAGTDFLQSCYDSHPEIASTCEKSTELFDFIKDNKILLPQSSKVFSALAIQQLIFSFAPYTNFVEDWRIDKKLNYKKAEVNKFIESLSFLLKKKSNIENEMNIAKSIILAFNYSIGNKITSIKTFLLHLHHINLLKKIDHNLMSDDLIIICSRNTYDLVASGVYHWRGYWEKIGLYEKLLDISLYRSVISRNLNDYLDLNKNLSSSNSKVYLTILEKLSSLKYLNQINENLSIKKFKIYPVSSILGIKRRGDLLSKDKSDKAIGSYDNNLVERGSPIKRLGIIDSILLTLISDKRIDKYNLKINSKIINQVIRLNSLLKFLLLIALIPLPTKIELDFYFELFRILLKIISTQKSNKNQKIKQLAYSLFYIISYPIEYLRVRILKIKIYINYLKNPSLIEEILVNKVKKI